MNATNKLLDKYLEACSSTVDKTIAERLHLRQSAVSNWRSGRAHPDAISIEKMAHAIGEPVGPWLASIEAERARGADNKRVWLRLAATLGTTLALAITALPSHANGRLNVQTESTLSAYCVKFDKVGRQPLGCRTISPSRSFSLRTVPSLHGTDGCGLNQRPDAGTNTQVTPPMHAAGNGFGMGGTASDGSTRADTMSAF